MSDDDDYELCRPLRHLPPGGGMVEITTRTIHGRYLCKPSPECVEIAEGVLGRALFLYPSVALHGYWFLSNHYGLMLSIPDVETMSKFMNYVNSNLARKLGALYGWRDKFWSRRYRAIVVVGERAQVRRLKYLLSQGCKEGLVARPGEWPGANCLRALLEGTTAFGRWVDRTRQHHAKKPGKARAPFSFASWYAVPLRPLPCWEKLPVDEQRARVARLVRRIEHQTALLNRRKQRTPIGVNAVLRENPHNHPESPARSPAPPCHASSYDGRQKHLGQYFDFVRVYRDASKRWREGLLDAVNEFPPRCFLPRPPRSIRSAVAPPPILGRPMLQ